MTDKPLQLEPNQLAQGKASAGVSASKKVGAQSTPDSSYQSYLFGSSGSEDHPAWSDSTKGRAAIRLFSRGVVGAAFFTIGGRMGRMHMEGYDPNASWGQIKGNQWLQYVAKGFDATLGKGIQKTVTTFAKIKHGDAVGLDGIKIAEKIGHDAVTFRGTKKFDGNYGRSYGHDIVGFTFEFAMASVGDALARNVIQAFDPNVKKSWKVNDEGKPAIKGEKWHFLPGEFLKWSGATAWRIFGKNQGEDWAAAIPYAFQMKYQRQALNKAFGGRWKGHEVQFDQGWNGGAFRVDPQKVTSTNPHGIIGDLQLAGAIDLHARFTGYNWYTLMYREAYDAIGNAFTQWKNNGFKVDLTLPKHFNPITSTLDGVGHTARYMTKSFIKANMFMNPAVIPFWMMRVPQSRWRGENFIHDGKLGDKTHIGLEGGLKPFHDSVYDHYEKTDKLSYRFEKGFSKTLKPLGEFSNWVGGHAANAGDALASKGFWPKRNSWLGEIIEGGVGGRRDFMHNVTDASLSYTPYMWAKAETALRVDDNKGDGKLGQMDVAIYKFMDDMASFKLGSIKGDIKKMWNLGTNFERPLKAREGAEPDAQQIVEAPHHTTRPKTLVHAKTIEQAPHSTLRRAPSANDADYSDDKKWAQMVSGSDINAARFHPASPTRH